MYLHQIYLFPITKLTYNAKISNVPISKLTLSIYYAYIECLDIECSYIKLADFHLLCLHKMP